MDTEPSIGAALDAAQIAPGTRIDHFKVMRLLGAGGMAQVYLARDTLLGRKVALKVIKPATLGSAEAKARFLFEARATARFSHPHIVTIFAVGEHEGRPYVALEYLEGQTLRERINEARPSVRDALRLAHAIAEALAEAHRHQILHRDLKPENVLIPRDGRLRVVDFGLAKSVGGGEPAASAEPPSIELAADPSAACLEDLEQNATLELFLSDARGLRGTPQYMSPEQWSGVECTGATDVWALGLILYEMLVGRLPYEASTALQLACKVCDSEPVPDVAAAAEAPDEVARLVARCLAKDPAERPGSAEVVERLAELMGRRPAEPSDARSPFRGLLPFSERHSEFFFGRDAEVGAFLERLREEPVMPVVGPSGAGKSSFVQAGVIPRLREQGRWIVVRLRPGVQPLRALAARLRSGETATHDRSGASFPPPTSDDDLHLEPTRESSAAGHGDDDLAQQLLEAPTQLNLHLQRLATQSQARVLLFVDQLEEVYTQTSDEAVRRAFMTALCTAADDPQDPVRVIFTLRDDFLGRLAEGLEAREALSHVTVLRSPDAATLEEVLTRPAAVVGYAYDDPALVPEMVAAVGGEAACLPLLQFVTRTLWDRRDAARRLLLRQVYDEVGGVAGALAHHAEGVLEGMSPSQVELTRQLLVALVSPEGTRRAASRSELLSSLGPEAPELLDRLVGARLVSVRKGLVAGGAGGREAVLELAHESLVRRWARLARWVDAGRDELDLLAQVEQAAELWDRRGRRPEELWAGDALGDAQRRLATVWSRASDAARRFLEAGLARAVRRRRNARLRRVAWTAGLVAIACAAIAVAITFADKNRELEDQQRQTRVQAEAVRLRMAESEREGARAALARRSPLEARSRLRTALEVVDSTLARALWWRASEEPLRWSLKLPSYNYDVAFSPDGSRLAVASQDKAVHIYDTMTGLETRALRGHPDQVFAVAYSPDGRSIASATWSGDLLLWDVARATSKRLGEIHSEIARLAFSPDGSLVATSSTIGEVHLWDVRGRDPRRTLTLRGDAVLDLAFSPDGASLAVIDAMDDLSIFAAPWTGEPRRIEVRMPRGLDFSPDGSRIVLATLTGLRVVDLATGSVTVGEVADGRQLESVAFGPGGGPLATAGIGGDVTLWDLARRAPLSVLAGHGEWITGMAFSPDGSRFATVDSDGSVNVWSTSTAGGLEPEGGHLGFVLAVAFNPNGEQIASGGADGSIKLWDVATGRVERVLDGHAGGVTTLAYGPSGRLLGSGGNDEVVRLWNLVGGEQHWTLAGNYSAVTSLAFGLNKLVAATNDYLISVWDIPSRSRKTVFSGHESSIMQVAVSPDGTTIASAGADHTVRTWSLTREVPELVLDEHAEAVRSVDFSPDGARLLSGGEDGTIRQWSLPDGASSVLLHQKARIYSVSHRPDGKQLAATGSDGVVRLRSLETDEVVTLEGHRAEVNFAVYSPDGASVATASDDGTVRLWSSATGLPVWRCPILIPAGVLQAPGPVILTHRGWATLGGGEERPAPQQAAWARRVEEAARHAVISRSGETLCLRTFDDQLEVWDVVGDRRLQSSRLEGLASVEALDGGCLSLAGRTARLHPREGPMRPLFDGPVSAIDVGGPAGDQVLLAAGGRVVVLSPEGRELERFATGSRGRAMALTDEWLALGFADGSIELWSREGHRRASFTFRGTPSSPATALVPGPRGTLVAGFANGLVGLWDLETGFDLWQRTLNGAVVHVALHGGELSVATDLGDTRTVDLGVFELDECELLDRVWREVPTTWRGGAAGPTAIPREHRCSPSPSPLPPGEG